MRRGHVFAASRLGLGLASPRMQTQPKLSELALRMEQLELRVSRLAPQQFSPSVTASSGTSLATSPGGAATHLLDTRMFTELYEFSSRQPMRRKTFQNLRLIDNDIDLRNFTVYMSREIQIRLAHNAAELAHAPFGFGQMEAIQRLRHLHEQSYLDLANLKLNVSTVNDQTIIRLCAALLIIFRRHFVTTDLVAQGINEFILRNRLDEGATSVGVEQHNHAVKELYEDYDQLQHHLVAMFINRARIRFLIGHFVEAVRQIMPEAAADALSANPQVAIEDAELAPRFLGHDPHAFVGLICRDTNMVTVAKFAIENARAAMSEEGTNDVPEVKLRVVGDEHFVFTYPPKQAFNIISSLVAHALKQEMRKRSMYVLDPASAKAHPIDVLISQKRGQQDVVVRIHDRGGGMPYNELEYASGFLHSGRTTQVLATQGGNRQDAMRGWMKSSLRLPVATCLARTFGGDLTVAAVDGVSTTVCYTAPCNGIDDLWL
jgi:hypothetical protein